ncbi:alpha/beta hydrolase [Microbaculum marinum]|uniref:Alpha/beta hydrolase n=1 Tax=Microbaculum marinum TaxID=1764581 RepID=A0AAW9RTD1_9HYPH
MSLISTARGDIAILRPDIAEAAQGGLPTILVHGSGGRADIWSPVLSLFTELDPIAIDLPGHGLSPGPLCRSVEDAADVVDAVRRALGLSRVAVVGHSLGGAIAQSYALEQSEHCAGIVIANSGCVFFVDREGLPRILDNWPVMMEHFARGQVSPRASQSMMEAARQLVMKRDPAVLTHDLELCAGFDSRDWVSKIQPACLIVTACEDQLTPFEHSTDLLARIPHAQFTAIGPAGHSIMLEHPIRFAGAIDSFFRELRESCTVNEEPA